MRIGILTLQFNNNYGGLLQAYALQSYLKERGHEVYVIQKPFGATLSLEIKRIIRKLLGREASVNSKNMSDFQHNILNETDIAYTTNGIKSIVKKYALDAIVVGSDQVWRYSEHYNKYKRYFLKFTENMNVKKITFAASFGVDFWEADEKQTFIAKEMIRKFDAVSVRERSGIDLCRKYLDYNKAIQLFDPTLLHNADFYRKLYTGIEIDNSSKIGLFILDSSKQKDILISNFEKETGKSSFTIGKYQKEGRCYFPSVQQWLKDFDTADYIITDSFHGMVFSIIFGKPFCVIGNHQRGLTRFVSLLNTFGLQDRLIEENVEIVPYGKVLSEPDYSNSQEKIESNKKSSNEFLVNCL